MMYGPMGTFTSMHFEGGAFCSTNVVTNEEGEKFWLCVDLPSIRLLMVVLSGLGLQTNKCPHRKEGKLCGKGRTCTVCSCEKSGFHGPGFIITPEFLQAHNIPFFTLVQKAGDLVFTFPGVAHQIVNTRSTVCEARNIMPLTFAFDRHADLVCDCGPEVGGRVLHHLDLHVMPSIPYDAFCERCKKVFFFRRRSSIG